MITIGYCSKEHIEGYNEHLLKTCGLDKKKVQLIEIINNGDKSLTECYNEMIDKSNYNIVVFLHNDLIIETIQWGKKLLRLFENYPHYGVIGLAGTDILSNGMWWSDKTKMYGQVRHMHEGKIHRNDYSGTFGDSLKEVVTVDGLFFAIDKTKIKHRFDEDFKGFHFYDLSFCVPNFIDGVKIGVTTKILVTHKSIGQTNKQWEKNKLFFEAKYYKSFPIHVQ